MNYSKQRNLILDIVNQSYDHPTAEEVHQMAQRKQKNIGLATVYRNLNQLAENGQINKIRVGSGQDRFDGHMEEHYHLLCKRCGKLQDLRPSPESIDALQQMAKEVFGLKVSNKANLSSTLMEGVCDECRKNKTV